MRGRVGVNGPWRHVRRGMARAFVASVAVVGLVGCGGSAGRSSPESPSTSECQRPQDGPVLPAPTTITVAPGHDETASRGTYWTSERIADAQARGDPVAYVGCPVASDAPTNADASFRDVAASDWVGLDVSADGRTLTVTTIGDVCGGSTRLDVTEQASTVRLHVSMTTPPGTCVAIGRPQTAAATLAAPLGDRAMVDDVSGQQLAPFVAIPAAMPAPTSTVR